MQVQGPELLTNKRYPSTSIQLTIGSLFMRIMNSVIHIYNVVLFQA